jgi:hypothetical protein
VLAGPIALFHRPVVAFHHDSDFRGLEGGCGVREHIHQFLLAIDGWTTLPGAIGSVKQAAARPSSNGIGVNAAVLDSNDQSQAL